MTDPAAVEHEPAQQQMPEVGRKAFICPRETCRVFAEQTWYVLSGELYFQNNVLQTSTVGTRARFATANAVPLHNRELDNDDEPWRASKCSSCESAALWHGSVLVYPALRSVGPPPSPDLPDTALELYEEGRQVAERSRRAGAALLRAALERLVKQLQPEGRTLNDKIGLLLPNVSAGLGMALDVLRDTGNGVLHDEVPDGVAALVVDESASSSSQVFDYLCDVVNRLTDELITRPKQDAEMFAKIPDGARAAIERRNATGRR
jgi:hypothetical protein